VNYPQQGYPAQPPTGYAQQEAYGQPQQGPVQQPGYPAQQQYSQQVQPYQQPPPPQQYQGWTQPPANGQPGYAFPQQPQPEPLPHAGLSDFYEQPATGGGPPLKFDHPGDRYVGVVIRSIGDADVTPATNLRTGEVSKHPDGRLKYVMKIPLLITPSPSFPEGTGVWYAKGNDRPELTRAMEAAGVEIDPKTGRLYPPKAGDVIDITFTHEQPNGRGMNPTKVKRVVYTKGNGEPPQMPNAPVVQGQVMQSQYQNGYQQAQPQQNYQVQYQPQQQQPGFSAPAGAAPYATSAPQTMPPAPGYQQPYNGPAAYDPDPRAMQQYQPQQAPFPTPGAPAAPQGFTPGAQPTAPASPSNGQPLAPDGTPWPADVPFIQGLTPDMARIAATMHHPAANGQPQ
jgi:hypothetical protein